MANRLITILRQSGWRVLLRGMLVMGVLAAIGFAANSIDFEETFTALAFTSDPGAPWYRGPVGFTLLSAIAICLSCPRQVVSFFAAYFFGLWAGIVIGVAGTTIGCIVSYYVAYAFKDYFRDFVRGRLDIAVRFWRDNTFMSTLIWRFLPVGSNLLTNLAAGAFNVPALRFFMGSAVGYVPQTVVFAFVGSGVKVESGTQLVISVLLFVISAVLGLSVYGRYRKRLKTEEGHAGPASLNE